MRRWVSVGGPLSLQGPLPILFTHFGDPWIRGSEILLLDLLGHLDPARVRAVVWCNGTEMADACRAAGFATHRSDFAYYFDADSPPFSPRTYAALVREGKSLVRQHDIRVLHANSAAPTQWLLPVARAGRLPLLTHLHIDYLRRSRFALLLHQADVLVGVSRQVVDDLLHDGVPSARTRVIYNGIDFKRLSALAATDLRPVLGIPLNTVVIGTAGSLIRRKGHDVLLQAISRLSGERAPHLLVAGGGPEQGRLEVLAAELGISARVHFLGHHDPIVDLYQSCDMVALASRADAFGLVLAEAGYCRRPVVATRVGGIPEVVLDGKTGLLVPPDDPAALAAAVSHLVDDAALRTTLGLAGRARAERVFSAERMAAEFQSEYERLARLARKGLGWARVAGRSRVYLGLLGRG
jgi:glycosyltransferase involved in cell wall biosynthesis